MNARIFLDNVSVYREGRTLFQKLSLTVNPGEFLGIIGPNGAGKTTLFHVILGLMQPQEGTVRITYENGRPVRPEMIGYVPQSRLIDPETPIQVLDFVSFGLPQKYRPWLTRKDKAAVREVLEWTGTAHLAHQAIGKLSGGEKQRVFLAQALVRNPKILLLDEPTSNLDPGAQDHVAAIVNKVCRQKRVSVLFISHDINLVSQYADRILFLAQGHYVVGTVQEVIRSDVLTRLYGTPVEVNKTGSGTPVTIPSG